MDRARLSKGLTDLVELVAKLRAPGGCPWDARQTFRTVRMYLLEEAYETLDAIEREMPGEICQELGDLLFQIVFLAYMGEEKGDFDLPDVMESIHEKMVRRHPHVFGSSSVESAEEVSANWAKIKELEKEKESKPASPFDTIPPALPALLRAHRLGERASKAGVAHMNRDRLSTRIQEHFREIEGADLEKDAELIRRRMGDLLFDLATLARDLGFNAEDLLRVANQRFVDRFGSGSEEES